MPNQEPAVQTDAASLQSLRRLADRGDGAACAALGARLLAGAGVAPDPGQAFALLSAGAERDAPQALSLLATLSGVGYLAPRSWDASLEYLRRAAVLGEPDARGQLRALNGMAAGSYPGDGDPQTWKRLAASVDIATWMSPCERQPVWETPRIRLAERFAHPAVCDWLRHRAEGRMRPAMMYDGTLRAEQLDPHRTCSDYEFDLLNTDVVLLLVRERIAATTKLPTVAMEPPRVFHYALGEQIKPHFDRCGDGVVGYGAISGYLGDRIVTFLLYLNDGYEGGELDFPKTGFRRKGAKGDALYFAHVDPAGKPDPLSLHAGLTITAGEKWVLSQWIHDRPFGVAGAPRDAGS